MSDPHDSLIPLLVQPVLFVAILLLTWLLVRLALFKTKFRSWTKFLIAVGVTMIALIVLNRMSDPVEFVFSFHWLFWVFYFPVIILLNTLFSIWYKS